jgi:hypothetical protein
VHEADVFPEEVVVEEGAKTVEAIIVVRTVCAVVNVEMAPTRLLMLLELPTPPTACRFLRAELVEVKRAACEHD